MRSFGQNGFQDYNLIRTVLEEGPFRIFELGTENPKSLRVGSCYKPIKAPIPENWML